MIRNRLLSSIAVLAGIGICLWATQGCTAGEAAAATKDQGHTATPLPPATNSYPVVVHNRLFVEVQLGSQPATFDITTVAVPQNVTITSQAGTRYVRPMNPVAVGYQTEVVDLVRNLVTNYIPWPPQPVIHHSIFVQLPARLKPQTAYQITVKAADGTTVASSTFSYTPDAVNRDIKVNQVGYLVNAKYKYAYLGGYLGSLGPLPLNDTDQFQLIDETTGGVVMSGAPALRTAGDPLSGEDVYQIDLSAFNVPGRYHLFVPGMGKSAAFEIRPDLYDPLLRDSSRFFYHQRCGMAIGPPHSPFPRPAWHDRTTDGFFNDAILTSPLRTTEQPGDRRDVAGGWHDAGDSGKYMPTATETVYILLAAYEMFPLRLGSDDANVPESGNGVPDILDEIRWELDWMLRMQDQADGGVYYKVNHPTWTSPETDPRYVAGKATFNTASFTAVMAAASRVLRPFFPTDADKYLAAALKSATYLTDHPDTSPQDGFLSNPAGIGGGCYGDKPTSQLFAADADNRAWAAAELYRTTCDSRYNLMFLSYRAMFDKYGIWHQPWNHWFSCERFAAWTYINTHLPDADTALQAQLRQIFINKANDVVAQLETMPYRSRIAHIGTIYLVRYDSATGDPIQNMYPLAQAWFLTKNRVYLDCLALQLDTALGTNALGRSYVTGYGTVRCIFPTHIPSQLDGIADPVPGMKIPGPYNGGRIYAGLTIWEDNTRPALPGTRIFYDIAQPKMCEPTIAVQAHQLAALAALAGLSELP